MKHPIVNIQQLSPGFYTYSIGMIDQPMFVCEDDFYTGAHCLRDASKVVGEGVNEVQICYAGTALGLVSLRRLRDDAESLFDELIGRLHATRKSSSSAPRIDEAASQE